MITVQDLKKLRGSNPATPRYVVLKDYLLGRLAANQLRPRDAIPTEQVLAEALGVARNTVRQALSELEGEGLIQRVRGRGTFVSGRAPQEDGEALSDVFALVVPELREGFHPSLVRGFNIAATTAGSQVLLCDTANDIDKQGNIILQLMDKRVAGVAIMPPDCGQASHQIRQLQSAGIPVVLLHRGVEGVSAPLIELPCAEVSALAAGQIAELGHRRIALVFGCEIPVAHVHCSGFQRSLSKAGITLSDELVHFGEPLSASREACELAIEKALDRMLNLPPDRRPTAVFCPWDPLAAQIYMLLVKKGVSVPEDVSVVGFGSIWREDAISRRLAAVTVDEEEVGRMAIDLLAQMARGDGRIDDEKRLVIPLDFYRGETLISVDE